MPAGFRNVEYFEQVQDELDSLGFRPASPARGAKHRRDGQRARRSTAKRAPAKTPSAAAPAWTFELTEVDGVLHWRVRAPAGTTAQPRGARAAALPQRAAARRSAAIRAAVAFDELPPSEVGRFLERLDAKFSRDTELGLKRISPAVVRAGELPREALRSIARPADSGRVLLLIHGTFSNSRNLVEELRATDAGRDFLGRAFARYEQVLAFDHWTLSADPVMNAFDLGRLFARSQAAVDVVAHSRGGLVARWWLEGFDGALAARYAAAARGGAAARGAAAARTSALRRAVLVGSPLGGTSLAAPPRLRAAIDLLTNVFRVVGEAGGALGVGLPATAVLAGLLRVITSVAGAAVDAPLLDAAIAMIPGLAGQSRVGNNPELERLLHGGLRPRPEYSVVKADFEPPPLGWAFWRWFVAAKQRAADLGADLVFDGPNDLVVDTASMDQLTARALRRPLASAAQLDFGTTDQVHHLNYFRQPRTLAFIERRLQLA